MGIKLLFLLVTFCVLETLAEELEGDDGLLVSTNSGDLNGGFETTEGGTQFRVFRGIPFAEPPLGPLRFKMPTPINKWNVVRNATQPPDVCVQVPYGTTDVIGTEDCLFLNVFTPALKKKGRKNFYPVVVYIHGSEYRRGSGNSNKPDFFIERNIIFVTLQYRLAAFGFLSTGDEVVPGNNGLRDQNLALRWVKDNIAEFSGDPHSITLMGQSSGAAGARFQVVSPQGKGLFHRIITHGGNEMCAMPANSRDYVTNLGKRLAGLLDCPTDNSQQLVDCLRTKDPVDIAKYENTFPEVQQHKYGFVPMIEVKHPKAFISEYPWNYIKDGRSSEVPWLNGVTLNEGALRVITYQANPSMLENFDEHFEELLPNNDQFTIQEECQASVVKKVRNFYFGNSSLQEADTQDFIDLISDVRTVGCSQLSMKLHHKYAKKPLYYLLFTYKGYVSYADSKMTGFEYTPVEYDNEFYTFPPSGFFATFNRTEKDYKMSEIYSDLLANFARHGNPTPGKKPPVKWSPVSSPKRNEFLLIEGPEDLEMSEKMFEERHRFWVKLCKKFNCLKKFYD